MRTYPRGVIPASTGQSRCRSPHRSSRAQAGTQYRTHRKPFTILFYLFVLTLSLPLHATTLTYQATNKWVAQNDAKPLRQVLNDAKSGKTHFLVTLPESNRATSITRLEVLRDLLEREAKHGIILEETTPATAQPNTINITPK